MRRRTQLSVELIESRQLLSALAYSLTTNQSTYEVGQPINFTFTETNTGTSPVNIAIGPVNSGFDVVHDGVTVWASNTGIQPQFLQLKTLQPGQSETLTATWNGVSNIGPPTVETGTFTVTNQQAPTGASATFQIENAASPPTHTPNENDPPISVKLTTNKPAYRLGQPVLMTLTLTNTSDAAVAIAPNSSSDGFYASRGGAVVWHHAATGGPDASLSLAPGQTVTFTTTWNGRTNQHGGAVRPGLYTLIADEGNYEISTTIEIGEHGPLARAKKG
jgi:hypothetical protein